MSMSRRRGANVCVVAILDLKVTHAFWWSFPEFDCLTGLRCRSIKTCRIVGGAIRTFISYDDRTVPTGKVNANLAKSELICPSAAASVREGMADSVKKGQVATDLQLRMDILMYTAETEVFIDKIQRQLSAGFGFIPLVGAGLSVSSGIPATRQLKSYLAYCIALSLKIVCSATAHREWNPREHPWPPLGDVALCGSADWEEQIWQKLSDLRRTDSGTSNHLLATMQEAFGSLADWRSSLLFLSRLTFHDNIPMCGAPDNQVIDSFFLHIVTTKKPNLGHKMLAFLAERLRIHVILTTNFDDLIEKAFDDADSPLTMFDVHLNAALPPARIVSSGNSLIKLHGGRYGLRADFSLDEQPTHDDYRNFCGYLIGKELNVADWQQADSLETKYHLLIAGVSANDNRILAFLTSAIKTLPNLQLFWLYYAEQDLRLLKHGFENCTRLHLLQYQSLGLFFLETYQRICKCMPPGGTEFPAVWQLPMPPQPPISSLPTRELKQSYDQTYKRLSSAADGRSEHSKVIVVESEKTVHGVSTLCSQLFDQLSVRANCIWLDLDDFFDTEDLYIHMMHAIARQSGQAELPPIALRVSLQKPYHDLTRYLESLKPWILFLNARDGPGTNAGSLDDDTDNKWHPEESRKFWRLVSDLTAHSELPITIIVSSHADKLQAGQDQISVETISLERSCVSFDPEVAVAATLLWIKNPEQGGAVARFVYALTLFHQARYPASLWTWAVVDGANTAGDRDERRVTLADQWLMELSRKGVIQYKPGGFVWMHREIRQRLKMHLEQHYGQREFKAEIHQCIADWYEKLFYSSGDPRAVFESVFHRCECARASRDTCHMVMGRSAIQQSINLLNFGRDTVLSRGYSEATYRWLEALRNAIGDRRDDISERLRRKCDELVVDVAREVADFGKASQYLLRDSGRTGTIVSCPSRKCHLSGSDASVDECDELIVCASP